MAFDDHIALADALLPFVLAAARIEMRHFHAGVAVDRKGDASPVTAADREAESVLLDGLRRAQPGVPVIAEEESATGGQAKAAADCFFLVDPLDGTRQFIQQIPEFTINIGLIMSRRPVFGLVYAPAFGQFYVTRGDGAAVETRLPPASDVRSLGDATLRPLRTRAPDLAKLAALESRSHKGGTSADFLSGLTITERRDVGSSLKFCLVARGDADLYARLGATCEWDTAAGHAILAAAGGTVAALDGTPLAYGKASAGYVNPPFVAWARNPLAVGA